MVQTRSAASRSSVEYAALAIFAATTLIKILCAPFYRSTDFDVHRNWLALTHQLPIKEWYYEHTSEWTLDYPPFFAYFELLLSYPARYFDPAMLLISATPYQSPMTVLYQRLTVIVSDLMLYYAIMQFVNARTSWYESYTKSQRQLTLFFLCICNPGLIMLDHIHFQYNGFLLGIFLLSITAIMRDRYLLSAFWFSVLLQFKHIFLYVAPVYFVYLLMHYCVRRETKQGEERIVGLSIIRLIKLGSIVIAIFLISLGPFIAWGQIGQVLSRLFPFQRGLCHAYWAPNIWVFYNLLDKILITLGKRAGFAITQGQSTSSGLVEEIAHIVLPNVKSTYTFVVTIAAMMPVLLRLGRRSHPSVFISSLIYCSLCSFMLGWHVHEKAILLTILPLGLCACDSLHDAKTFLFLSIVGHYSLFPLLFRSTETPLKIMLFLIFTLLSIRLLSNYHRAQQAARRIEYVGLFHVVEKVYLIGLAPLYVLTQAVLPLLLPSMPFLPLLLTSTYCAVGCTYAWYLCFVSVKLRVKRLEEDEEHVQ